MNVTNLGNAMSYIVDVWHVTMSLTSNDFMLITNNSHSIVPIRSSLPSFWTEVTVDTTLAVFI